jgi:hypothetical protein
MHAALKTFEQVRTGAKARVPGSDETSERDATERSH